jgi:hypothetical protein
MYGRSAPAALWRSTAATGAAERRCFLHGRVTPPSTCSALGMVHLLLEYCWDSALEGATLFLCYVGWRSLLKRTRLPAVGGSTVNWNHSAQWQDLPEC